MEGRERFGVRGVGSRKACRGIFGLLVYFGLGYSLGGDGGVAAGWREITFRLL